MLLNSFAQPTLLAPHKTHLNFKDFQKAPLLLCHKNGLEGKRLPIDWAGNLYGTQEILNGINRKKYNLKFSCNQVLTPNVVHNLNISDDECHGKVKNIELTVIPWDNQYVMYLIKADNVTILLTDMITENMEVFVENKILRNSIKTGIDVLYINDGVYHDSTMLKKCPSECMLGALATLVRPRYILGLFKDDQLPPYLLNFCTDFPDK